MTSLEALKIMVKDNDLELPYHNTIICIEKELKALEIIKKYPFVVNLDFRLNYNEQIELVKEHITEEEYDLLKEILIDGINKRELL